MEKKYFVLVFISVLLIVFFISLGILSKWIYFGGDNHYTILFGEHLAENSTITIPVPANNILDRQIIGIRGQGIYNDKVAPGLQIGMIVLVALFLKTVSTIIIIPLFFFGLTWIYLYKLLKFMFKTNSSLELIVSCIALFFPPIFIHLIFLNNNPYALTFFIISFYYCMKYIKEGYKSNLILFGVFGSISVIFNYILAPFILFIYLSIFFYRIKGERKIREKLLSVLPVFIYAFTLFLVFKIVYGSYLGYLKIPNQLRNDAWFLQNSGLGKYAISNIFINGFYSIESLVVYVLLFIILGLLFIYLKKENFDEKRFVSLLIFLSIVHFAFFAAQQWSTFQKVTYFDAILRYSILLWLLFFVGLMSTFNMMKNKKIVLFSLIILYLFFTIISLNILFDYTKSLSSVENEEKLIESIVNPEDIVFAKTSKNVYPYAMTAIYQNYPYETRIENTTLSIKKLLLNNLTIYFYDQNFEVDLNEKDYSFNEYSTYFIKEGLVTKKTKNPHLFKIELRTTKEQNEKL